jgi:hypothetical protein
VYNEVLVLYIVQGCQVFAHLGEEGGLVRGIQIGDNAVLLENILDFHDGSLLLVSARSESRFLFLCSIYIMVLPIA